MSWSVIPKLSQNFQRNLKTRKIKQGEQGDYKWRSGYRSGYIWGTLFFALIILGGCGNVPTIVPTPEPTNTLVSFAPPLEVLSTATPREYPTYTPQPTPTVTLTPIPFTPTPTLAPLSVDAAGGQVVSLKLNSTDQGIEVYNLVYLSDGLKVTGYILKPAGNGPFPGMVWNHGGVGDAANVSEFISFAKNGYVVVATNYRGIAGSEGKEDLGGKDPNDVYNALKVLRLQPYVDLKRIVMAGASRGGLETLLTLERLPDPSWIRAAVVFFPPTDMYALFNHFDKIPVAQRPKVINDAQAVINCPPTQCDEAYRIRSPVFYADKIQAPILLLHGDADSIVPVTHSINMSAALKRAGKVAKLVIYPGFGHSFTPGDWTDPLLQTKNWLEKYNN